MDYWAQKSPAAAPAARWRCSAGTAPRLRQPSSSVVESYRLSSGIDQPYIFQGSSAGADAFGVLVIPYQAGPDDGRLEVR